MWLAAPAETKKAAVAAILVGLGGVVFSLLRSFRLTAASERLGKIDIGSETAASRWEHVRQAASLRSFSRMMDRLDRSRRLGSAEPEATWRAAFDLVADGEERYEAIVRSLASVAVLSGLAGTVLGFARLVEPMLAIQQNGAPASLTAELGGAFLATLAGILGAVLILLFAVPWLRRAEETWLTAVEDIGRLVLIPSLPRPPTRIQDVVLEELKRRLETVKEGWVEALSEPAKQLAGIATSASSSVDKLASALKGSYSGNTERVGDQRTFDENIGECHGEVRDEIRGRKCRGREGLCGIGKSITRVPGCFECQLSQSPSGGKVRHWRPRAGETQW